MVIFQLCECLPEGTVFEVSLVQPSCFAGQTITYQDSSPLILVEYWLAGIPTPYVTVYDN